MHFITNDYKRFSKTNSTDPRQRVPLMTFFVRPVLQIPVMVFKFLANPPMVVSEQNNPILLEDDSSTLEQQNITEDQNVLIEVRNKDLSWPEEMSLLAKSKQDNKKQGQNCI